MISENCKFCKLIEERIEIFRENDLFIMKFDLNPISPWHAIILPQRHIVNLSDLNQNEWISLKGTIEDAIRAIQEADLNAVYTDILTRKIPANAKWFCKKVLDSPYIKQTPYDFNHGVNDGRAAWRTVDHLHRHIIPRYEWDMEDPRGGVRYVIPEMGNYKIRR